MSNPLDWPTTEHDWWLMKYYSTTGERFFKKEMVRFRGDRIRLVGRLVWLDREAAREHFGKPSFTPAQRRNNGGI